MKYKVSMAMKYGEKLVFRCDSAEAMENMVLMLKNAKYTDHDTEKDIDIYIEPVFQGENNGKEE